MDGNDFIKQVNAFNGFQESEERAVTMKRLYTENRRSR